MNNDKRIFGVVPTSWTWLTIIVDEIRESIETYEDRVQLIDVLADPNFENNSFDLTITYEIIGRNIPAQELQFVLQSSR